MEMADTGLAISGTAFGVIGTVAAAYIRSRFTSRGRKVSGSVEVTPDPLRVEIQKTYATKEELREAEDRFDRRLAASVSAVGEDVKDLRREIKENDMRAEARAVATHKRIDTVIDVCRPMGGNR